MEYLLHVRLQCHDRHRLRHPVNDIRDGDFILPSCNRMPGCFWIGAGLYWSGPRPQAG